MKLIIVPHKKGLTVNFQNLSTEVPSETIFEWDFGDGTQVVTGKNPSHTYSEIGFYEVIIKAIEQGDGAIELRLPIVVTDKATTSLGGSIYNLIDTYLPTGIVSTFPFEKKRVFIEKWQLYIQPLVNHDIKIEDYNNELHYEALENQLIMEAAMLDFLIVEFTNLLQSVSTSTAHIDETNPSAGESVKRIQTGPSEVEYFNPNETDKDIISNVIKAVQPGGYVDVLKNNLCTLALRLDIYLPFCNNPLSVFVPSITNIREPHKYMGPNPPFPIKKGG